MQVTITALLVLTAAAAYSQSPAFEVATVKVNPSGDNGAGFPGVRNGILTAKNVSLRMMLRVAYSLDERRIFGPDYLDSTRFDLAGKSPQGVPDSDVDPMLQSLLKERFHLAIHREMRELPVFDMVVAKSGLKMELSTAEKPFPKPPPIFTGNMNVGAGTMPEIAMRLTGAAGRPIVDKTGLEGRYGFLVIYMPLNFRTADGNPPENPPPDYFTAIEQQLGLKLEPAKEPIEVLVVDHVDRVPTEN